MKGLVQKLKATFVNKNSHEQARSNCRVFRVMMLVYLVSELIQQAIVVANSHGSGLRLASPSKLLSIIIISGVFICFEILMLAFAKVFSRYRCQIRLYGLYVPHFITHYARVLNTGANLPLGN